MHLKKQILRLYLLEIFGSFSLTDGIWIIFLIQRGFSLVEVGLAETVFHIASFLFEIPSGAIADLISGMKEPQVTEAQRNRAKFSFTTIGQELWRQLTESLRFLRRHTDIAVKMLLDALIGCGGTLTIFFLQQHFSANGISLG